jgi:hypothetical protein
MPSTGDDLARLQMKCVPSQYNRYISMLGVSCQAGYVVSSCKGVTIAKYETVHEL